MAHLTPALEAFLTEHLSSFDDLEARFTAWLKGNPISQHIFIEPVQTEQKGWKIDNTSPRRLVIYWTETARRFLSWGPSGPAYPEPIVNLVQSWEPDLSAENLQDEIRHLFAGILPLLYSDKERSARIMSAAVRCYNYLARTEESFTAILPLHSIQIPREITFKHGRIFKPSWTDRLDLISLNPMLASGAGPRFATFRSILSADCLLVIKYKCARLAPSGFPPGEFNRIKDDLWNLIRMYDFGAVSYAWALCYRAHVDIQILYEMDVGQVHAMQNPGLDVHDGVHFERYLTKYIDSPIGQGPLGFVVERLHEAWLMSRNRSFRIFDYVSILEALLVQANEGEFRFKVPSLGAAFGAATTPGIYPKRRMYELLRKAYDVRSRVAHCSKDTKVTSLSDHDLQVIGILTHRAVRLSLEHGPEYVREMAMTELLGPTLP